MYSFDFEDDCEYTTSGPLGHCFSIVAAEASYEGPQKGGVYPIGNGFNESLANFSAMNTKGYLREFTYPSENPTLNDTSVTSIQFNLSKNPEIAGIEFMVYDASREEIEDLKAMTASFRLAD